MCNIYTNVPNLRFNYHEYGWEKVDLKGIVTRITRKNIGNQCTLPLTISAQYGLINQHDFFNKQIASKDMSNYYLLNKGEFAYNKSYSKDYPLGAVKRLEKYERGALSSLYICFKPKNESISNFLVHYFESSKWHKGVSNISVEGARNHGLLNISVNDYFLTKHYIPTNKEEQDKIATFLDLIDKRIETQNKIIEELKRLKNGISTRVFESKNKYKLKKFITQISEHNIDELITNVLSVSNKLGFVNQNEQFDDREVASKNKRSYKIVNHNQFAYNPARINVGSIARLKKFKIGIVSPMYICFETNEKLLNSELFEHYISTNLFCKQVNKKLEGSVRQCLSFESLKEIKIPLFDIEKQDYLAKNLNNFSLMIEIESYYLEKLILQKQYLLKNMFI